MTRGNEMKKTPYKILKLRSGEELIAKICGESNGKLILERPMIFKTVLLSSPSGRQREITVLKNWLSLSNAIETKIPKDFIATFLEPDSGVIELYDLEKEKEDIDPPTKRKIVEGKDAVKDSNKDSKSKKKSSPNISDMMNELSEDNIRNLFDLIQRDIRENPELMNELSDSPSPYSPFPPDNETQNWISMSMFFPPEALLALVDAGLLDLEDVQNLIESLSQDPNNKEQDPHNRKISDIDTSDETERKDYGSKWTDWSPDLRDYFE